MPRRGPPVDERDNPASSIHPIRLIETCAKCHASPEFVKLTGVKLIQPIEAYKSSVERMKWVLGRRKDMPPSGALGYPMDTAWLNGKEDPGRMLERNQSTVPLPGDAPAAHTEAAPAPNPSDEAEPAE